MGQIFTLAERVEYFKRYGAHCLAYSTLQPGMKYVDFEGSGYLAYMEKGGIRFYLTEPIGPRQAHREMIARALSEHPNSCFVQVQQDTAELLHDEFDFYATPMGIESHVDVDGWSLSGKHKTHVRRWVNTARNAGLDVHEREDSLGFDAISEAWRRTKKAKGKLQFLVNEPFRATADCGYRMFLAHAQGQPVAGVAIDPVYRDGELSGYYANVIRAHPDAPNGATDLILHSLMQGLQAEHPGRGLGLALGLSPFSRLAPCRTETPVLRKIFGLLHKHGNSLYSFKGLEFHKQRYGGTERPVFLATLGRLPALTVFQVFRLVGII